MEWTDREALAGLRANHQGESQRGVARTRRSRNMKIQSEYADPNR